MFYDYKSLKTNASDNRRNDVNQNDMFYVKLDDDYDVIKIELILSLIDNVTNTVDCKIYNAYDSNFLCIKHYEKINLISVNNNLGDLENTILSNSSKINNIKNSIYLKDIYNILFYNLKTQVDFRGLFFEKIFEVNAMQNDFIEMNFKIYLQYEIFDENDNSLYIKSTNNDKYSYFSNRVIADENIFYNFNKDVKKIRFVIKFQILLPNVIKIWYIKNYNYRLIIKNYGL